MTDNPKKPAAVAPHPNSQPLATMSDEMLAATAEDAGAGISENFGDFLLPMITVLQSNSPQVDTRSSTYIKDAVAGAFWARNDLVPIRDGVAGFDCIPLKMEDVFVEWGPQRGSGGPFGRHPKLPADAEQRISTEDGHKKKVWVRGDSGNVLQEAREWYISVDNKLYLLPMHGSGHSVARRWQTLMAQFRHPQTGDTMPAYSRKYHLSTIGQSNSMGRWFNIKVEDRGLISMPEYRAARELYLIVKRGAFRIDTSDTAALTSDAA
jgi:hypothetical protein